MTLRPDPIPVESARVARGVLRVTIDEEGKTRVHDRFVIAALVGGRLARIELREGDPIEVNQILTTIAPLPLGAREREEQLAKVAAAEALQKETEAQVRHAQVEFEQARRERVRAEELVKEGFATQQTIERARLAETTSASALNAAQFKARSAAEEVKLARAGLLALTTRDGAEDHVIPVRSPVTGRVLRVLEQSERVVAAGVPLLTVGDPDKLEIVVDVLSTDAVKVPEAAPVLIENWGGTQQLRAHVQTVEPSAFTKVSALDVEEQRVNIVAIFEEPPRALGDGYRVEARIVVWEQDQALKIPVSALFRRGSGWSVFVIERDRARPRDVTVGHLNAFEAEILHGLQEGEVVIRHPTNLLEEGTRVAVRTP